MANGPKTRERRWLRGTGGMRTRCYVSDSSSRDEGMRMDGQEKEVVVMEG